jgi:hypothetical protein
VLDYLGLDSQKSHQHIVTLEFEKQLLLIYLTITMRFDTTIIFPDNRILMHGKMSTLQRKDRSHTS